MVIKNYKMQNSNLRISIIIPAYNVVAFLIDCLDSIFSQDIDTNSYEVIVVDDCSPHDERSIVSVYLEKYPNIRYIRHDVNKRQGGARNTGIRAANGEYVMFLDADDFLVYRNTLSILLNLLEYYNPTILRSETFQIFPSEIQYNKQPPPFMDDRVKHHQCGFEDWRLGKMSCSACGTLYKRMFLLDNMLFFREYVLFEDTDWTQKVMCYAKNVDFIDFAFYGYRQSQESTTRGYTTESFDGAIEGVVETYRFYESVDVTNNLRCYIHEKIIDNTIAFLKFSRNYPVKTSRRMLNKINAYGLTSMKSCKMWKNIEMSMMKATPLLCVVVVRFGVSIKRLIKGILLKK